MNVPGQKGLVLFYGVQFISGGITSLAWHLSLGVVSGACPGDVNVAATELAAALQGRRR